MTINQLRCFIAVAEHMHFTKAAEALHISQPSLSYQVASLETELGISLIARNTRSMEVTPMGRRFYAEAKDLIEHFESIERGGISLGEEKQSYRDIRIAADYDVFHGAPEVYRTFIDTISFVKDNYPRVHVRISFGNSAECDEKLQSGHADISFGTLDTMPFDEGFTAREIQRSGLALVAPVGIAGADDQSAKSNLASFLQRYPTFLFAGFSGVLPGCVSWLYDNGCSAQVRLQEHPLLAMIMVDLGIGASFVPALALSAIDHSKYAVYPLPEDVALKRYMRYTKADEHPLVPMFAERFLEALRP
ncbi:MAG: LysR family transcriptional regulator [Lachnospiraceae bacterium]|jgi:DNA-binding transcriptional LysR family regulator|nr:LysR family transcriptional regulator [Lachnospiraceae bacterium]